MDKYSFQVRVTGVLIENRRVLLVKQKINSNRGWSLPGGRAEAGEKLEDSIVRELFEETGLITKVIKLLYLCDKPDSTPPILHITFLLDKIGGETALPSNEFDANPISDVQFVNFTDLKGLGFSQRFIDILENGFPDSGSYMGLKESIGL